jgi:serine/threonine protein kinase
MSTQPDDRTLLAPAGTQPGANAAPAISVDYALPLGTHLDEFEITDVLGVGGFGIVYLVYDQLLQRHVALKEYLPAAFALRDTYGRVCPRTERDADAFGTGLRSFVNEGRLLAQFDAPSLLKVYRFWESNGTAYMVMPYYRGPTLKQMLAAADAPVAEGVLRHWLDGILDALALMHAQHCYHRDIAPDNILMVDGERPVLLDFGAARRAIGDMTQAFTTIFKHAYAPVEQISEYPDMHQGPWTDLFALAAVVHFAIDGKPPPPAISRLMSDSYVPLAQRHAGRYSASLLAAVDRALAVKPQDRPQSVEQMRALLGTADEPPAFEQAQGRTPPGSASPELSQALRPQSPQQQPSAPATDSPRARRLPLAAAAGVVAIVGVGAAFYLSGRAPAPASAPVATTAEPALPAALPAAVQAPPAAGPDPAAAMAQVLAGASPDHAVSVSDSPARAVIGRDHFSFSIRAARGGYVYVHMLGNDQQKVAMIFPNAVDRNNHVAPGQTLTLPRPAWRMEVAGPAGTDRFVVIVSEVPRDFGGAGLVKGEIFSEFDLATAAAMVGTPVCAAASPCPQAYGAAAFTIDEVAH